MWVVVCGAAGCLSIAGHVRDSDFLRKVLMCMGRYGKILWNPDKDPILGLR